MKQRYSIWGREYGSDRDVEILQVNANPEAMRTALGKKMLKIEHSMYLSKGRRTSTVPKYSWLRIVENLDEKI
jgi:hypothetical protein